MLARHTACDVAVLALVGERGREVREFIEDDLGADGLARAVVVVATSDAPPLMRREAAYAAMTVAEHFRDQGKSRAAADGQRHPVLPGAARNRPVGRRAAGHPRLSAQRVRRTAAPAGARRPRAGTRRTRPAGHITALFTVLVEGDDHDEPVADAVRGILDGHVILDRRIGEGGRYPAVDVLRSLSRAVPGCNSDAENALTRRARAILALHADMADLVRLGAYRAGSDPAVDEAIAVAPRLEAVLRQGREERTSLADSFARLRAAIEGGTDMSRDPLETLARLRRSVVRGRPPGARRLPGRRGGRQHGDARRRSGDLPRTGVPPARWTPATARSRPSPPGCRRAGRRWRRRARRMPAPRPPPCRPAPCWRRRAPAPRRPTGCWPAAAAARDGGGGAARAGGARRGGGGGGSAAGRDASAVHPEQSQGSAGRPGLPPPSAPESLAFAPLVAGITRAMSIYPDVPNPDLLDRIPLDARVVLDVGCGSGALGAEYKRRNPGCRYLGIEPDPDAARIAARRLDEVATG